MKSPGGVKWSRLLRVSVHLSALSLCAVETPPHKGLKGSRRVNDRLAPVATALLGGRAVSAGAQAKHFLSSWATWTSGVL